MVGFSAFCLCRVSPLSNSVATVTYKQAQFAARYRGETDSEGVLRDATTIRIHGTRLPICEKNVGQSKYAFNSVSDCLQNLSLYIYPLQKTPLT